MKEIKKVSFNELFRAHKYVDRALNLGYVCRMTNLKNAWQVHVIEVIK